MISWSEEMDAILKAGIAAGKSARVLGDEIGVTRNSVLGRTFRLGLSHTQDSPRVPSVRFLRGVKSTMLDVVKRKNILPSGVAERIRDMRDLGYSWTEIGADLGVSVQTARNYAIKFGILAPKALNPPFTKDDYAYIAAAWNNNVPIEEIADKLNRSFGAIRQKVHKLKVRGEISSRDGTKTRLLKRYGEAALLAAETPAEALKKINEAKQEAFAAARNAARDAKRKAHDLAMATMRASLAAGVERNAALFACRAEGVSLEEIGAEVGLTRERVRQICDAHAGVIALKKLVASRQARTGE